MLQWFDRSFTGIRIVFILAGRQIDPGKGGNLMKKILSGRSIRMAVALLLAAIMAASLSLCASAAGNKALWTKVSFVPKGTMTDVEYWVRNTYALEAELPKAGKLNKKPLMDAKLIFPESLLKEEGDFLQVACRIRIDSGKKLTGFLEPAYLIRLTLQDGSLLLHKEDTAANTLSAPGPNISLVKQGTNYVLTMRKVAINVASITNHFKMTFSKLLAKKETFTFYPQVLLNGNVSASTDECDVYVDDLSVKTKGLTQKVNFSSKKSYRKIRALRQDNPNLPVKVVTLP